MTGVERYISRFAAAVNEGIGHPFAFVAALVQTAIWTAVVLTTHLDRHGFWFLYTATAVSYVTQFTLTLVALQAKKEAARANAKLNAALSGIQSAVVALQAVVRAQRVGLVEQQEQGEVLDDVAAAATE